MDYYQPVRDQYIHDEMYPVDYRKDFFPKGAKNENLKLGPKPPCTPKFVTKIEGNAVEEGARVFFEGIVDSQPQPVFTWYFDDEEIFPGESGWEDSEIHHSRKMSTLILPYAREHHMGKYTLVAQNHLGHAISNCDLIVRKKQFPPVFWQRLVNTETTAGTRLVAEVEVGGWPLPEIVWFKDGELLVSKMHTENYNGYPNKYVPSRKIEIKQVDQIRYCIIFHRISEADSGIYTCRAVNALGEAICEAEFIVEAGEGGADEMYLPELWRTGKRLTWKDEDARRKPFVGVQEPELTPEDIASMTKRVASTPLPRAMEYFASLPNYEPLPMSTYGVMPMKFTADSGLKNVEKKTGKKGGQASFPSKFQPGQFTHSGYNIDDSGRILPIWTNPMDQFAPDPNTMHFRPVLPDYPEANPPPPEVDGPHGPPHWETQEMIKALYRMLESMGCRVELGSIRQDRVGNVQQARRQQQEQQKSYRKEHADARKQVMQNTPKSVAAVPKKAASAMQKRWEEKLNANMAGAQANAEDFTKQFMSDMYTGGQTQVMRQEQKQEQELVTYQQEMRVEKKEQRVVTLESQDQNEMYLKEQDEAPALPPKSTIMFSPSRQVFSPTPEEQMAKNGGKEFIPVKEKAKMIAKQQEEMIKREESSKVSGDMLKGGVCILPPSPVTVRREVNGVSSSRVEETSTASYGYSSESFGESSSTMVFSSNQQSVISSSREIPSHIPVLEDKYNVNENLEQLGGDSESTSTMEVASSTKSSRNVTFSKVMTMGSPLDLPLELHDVTTTAEDDQSVRTFDEDEFEALVKEQESVSEEQSGVVVSSPRDESNQEFTYHSGKDIQDGQESQRENSTTITTTKTKFSTSSSSSSSFATPPRKTPPQYAMVVATPPTARKLRQPTQSPVPMHEDSPRYRTPPQSPFQPAFYRTPKDTPDTNRNPSYKLPNQKTKTSTEVWMEGGNKEDAYDGDTEF